MTLPHRGFGWKYDLPAPNEPALLQSISDQLDPPPNQISQNHLEIPRSILKFRGYWIVIGPIVLLLVTLETTFAIFNYFSSFPKIDLALASVALATFTGSFFIVTPYLRFELELPRDEPIRFNRHRRKVYFYQYRMDRLHPFGRKNWGVKPVAYDWENLTAEVYRFYAPMGYGGLKEEVRISVCKPGTDEIIDRFFFTADIEKGKQYWNIARLFMQQGPDALPEFVNPPWEWNEGTHSNLFDQRAPKVQWPAEMDLESRTAPAQAEQP
ncbi:DUF6708 domain-containing protein [Pseudomonas sp. MN1F]|uniref:DUF6708 domain-containing protein n=1 Tax=Pseudomonas sp. MN1F TaxID=1366632 RepID=UPI002115BE33|nr:DUF6708 domain-containing protein [Pseudomonas sp. MN1F]